MSLKSITFQLIKKIGIIVLILSIAIPFRYGSTNRKYLRVRCLHSLFSLTYSIMNDYDRPQLSAGYRAFETILRLKPLVELDPLSDPISVIKEIRSEFSLGIIVPKPLLCEVEKQVYHHDGHEVDAYWINNNRTNQKPDKHVLIYLHGGAYMAGDIHSYSGFECHLSKLFHMKVVHLEYRLAPEHPLPSAVDDAVALYNGLLHENISPSNIILMGDSAGGGLCLLTIQSLISKNLPIPLGVIVLSPWADLSSSGQSYVRNRLLDAMIRHEAITWSIKHVLGDNEQLKNRDDPMFSPLFGSFKGFPPMYINFGTAELLEDDSRQVIDKAQKAGVDVTIEEGIHLAHVYPLFFPYYPEAEKTLENIRRWVNKKYQE